jgi:hypothetical protein
MSLDKRRLLLLAVLAAAGADIVFYGGSRLVARASRFSDPTARIEILERGQHLLGLNDILYRDLGRAAMEAAASDLTASGPRDAQLRRAYNAQLRSLAINPLSAATHFDLAQTLEYMRLFDLPAAEKPLAEYVKAVHLAGRDSDILSRTGKALLANWGALGNEDKRIVRDITRSVLAVKTDERLPEVLELWSLRVQDPAFMRAVLPADPAAYRKYAAFLAERSLDRGERIHFLAEAERLELVRAVENEAAGRGDLLALRLPEAEARFKAAQFLLGGIRFYQALEPGAEPLPADAVRALRKGVLLGIARVRLETAQTLEEALPELQAYMAAEDDATAFSALEKALRERRLLDAKPDPSGRNLGRLAFELDLAIRQNRSREVTAFGQSLEAGLVMITEAVRTDYARLLEIIGDAHQKLDYLYESNRFYLKVKDMLGAPSLRLLAKLEKNYERLNDSAALAALRIEATKVVPARVVEWPGLAVPKGTEFKHTFDLEAKESRLNLKALPDGPNPAYVSVAVNGRILWEDFLVGEAVSLDFTPETGSNEIEITPWNGTLLLARLAIEVQETAKPVPEKPAAKVPAKKPGREAAKVLSGRGGGGY